MPTEQEQNQFRRLVGDYTARAVTDREITQYLDDATNEVTNDFVEVTTPSGLLSSPLSQFEHFQTTTPKLVHSFNELYVQYHNEVIYKAAINWWWNKASEYASRLSTTVGGASQDVGKLYENAMNMITNLEERYEKIQTLGLDITMGNLSYFSKRTLTRVGGEKEEDAVSSGP